jgi:hypothetical protein
MTWNIQNPAYWVNNSCIYAVSYESPTSLAKTVKCLTASLCIFRIFTVCLFMVICMSFWLKYIKTSLEELTVFHGMSSIMFCNRIFTFFAAEMAYDLRQMWHCIFLHYWHKLGSEPSNNVLRTDTLLLNCTNNHHYNGWWQMTVDASHCLHSLVLTCRAEMMAHVLSSVIILILSAGCMQAEEF